MGLCAGDRNGGPVRMAVRLAESLVEKQTYDREDVIRRYHAWHKGPPYDTEKAFDTGLTFRSVFSAISTGKCSSVDEAAARLSQQAGCNAAHRSAPLAMAAFLSDSELWDICQQESTITHVHKLSVEGCFAIVFLCRRLVEGQTWEEAKTQLLSLSKDKEWSEESAQALSGQRSISTGGFMPDVLVTALHFVDESRDFASALSKSLQYAGSANFCPVLVGALAGARYGASNIPPNLINDAIVNRKERPRIERTATQLASSWLADKEDSEE
ncbi:ADP-ribosylglycohydrolase, variant 2 [Balamuthia mandrillaris]